MNMDRFGKGVDRNITGIAPEALGVWRENRWLPVSIQHCRPGLVVSYSETPQVNPCYAKASSHYRTYSIYDLSMQDNRYVECQLCRMPWIFPICSPSHPNGS